MYEYRKESYTSGKVGISKHDQDSNSLLPIFSSASILTQTLTMHNYLILQEKVNWLMDF